MIENKDQPLLWESWLFVWNYKDDIDKDIDRYECVCMSIYMCVYTTIYSHNKYGK